MTRQRALTLITPVKPDHHHDLRDELKKVRLELIESRHEPFENIGTIHFARWIILDSAVLEGEKLNARLVFSSNFDGEAEDHISALCDTAGTFIDRIYQYCEGYPEERTAASRADYLARFKVRSAAFYIGAPGRTLRQIREESTLRNYLRKKLDEKEWISVKPVDIHRHLQKEVLSNPEFEWAKQKTHLPSVNYPGMLLVAVVLIILLPVLLVWLLIIQVFYERKDTPLGLTPSQVSEPHIRHLEEYEDLERQNQFTQVLIMKKGMPRKITLNFFLAFAKSLIRFLFVEGKLMGIPTIHFARWVMIDGGKRMLFLSNFDGSWQQYLGDFIDKSGWGLTAIWSNSVGFPKTKFSLLGGAYDEEHFLAWSRYYEIPTQVWYSAYPGLSIKNIVNNSLIRSELAGNLSDRQAARFLKRL